jgi:hypothetical protein
MMSNGFPVSGSAPAAGPEALPAADPVPAGDPALEPAAVDPAVVDPAVVAPALVLDDAAADVAPVPLLELPHAASNREPATDNASTALALRTRLPLRIGRRRSAADSRDPVMQCVLCPRNCGGRNAAFRRSQPTCARRKGDYLGQTPWSTAKN